MRKRHSLALRIFVGMLAVFLIPGILSAVFFVYAVPSHMNEQARANVNLYMADMVDSTQAMLDAAREVSFTFMTDRNLRYAMNANGSEYVSSVRGRISTIVGSSRLFWPEQTRNVFRCAYIYNATDQAAGYSYAGQIYGERERLDKVYETAKYISDARNFYKGEAENKYYFILDYYNIDNARKVGKIIIEMNAGSVYDTDELVFVYPDAAIRLRNETAGENLYTFGTIPDKEDLEDYYVEKERIGNSHLILELFVPNKNMFSQLWLVVRVYLIGFVLIFILLLIFMGAMYRIYKRQFVQMEQLFKSMPASGYTKRLKESNYLEFQSMEEAFNDMADNLEVSLEDAYLKGIRLKESETKLLIGQINPHFVFNVLEAINMRCINAGQKEISHIVTDLAQLLRGNIGLTGINTPKVTFKTELEYVGYYADLQKLRFGENLSISIEYEDDDILDYYLPRLSIQPLVENAVAHGLEPKMGMGHISLRIWEEDSEIWVNVTDDGVGFTPGEESFLDDGKHHHIAVANIRRRLELLYGNRASLTINSTPGKGTEAILKVPVDTSER